MARVNLEDQLFGQARLLRLARELYLPAHAAIGILAFLWHDSQEYGAVEATAEEICEWARLETLSEWQSFSDRNGRGCEPSALIAALLSARFISPSGAGPAGPSDGVQRYVIHGNAEQVAGLKTYQQDKDQKIVAGKHRAASAIRDKKGHFLKKDPAERPAPLDTAGPPPLVQHSSGNAIQYNAIQEEEGTAPPPPISSKGEPATPDEITPGVWAMLVADFGSNFLADHLNGAFAQWECESDFRKAQGGKMKFVRRYLKIEKEAAAEKAKSPPPQPPPSGSVLGQPPPASAVQKAYEESLANDGPIADPAKVREILKGAKLGSGA